MNQTTGHMQNANMPKYISRIVILVYIRILYSKINFLNSLILLFWPITVGVVQVITEVEFIDFVTFLNISIALYFGNHF